jgi:phenylalanyl-tRNA synthetase beta subunit
LTEDQVNESFDKVVDYLTDQFNVEIR